MDIEQHFESLLRPGKVSAIHRWSLRSHRANSRLAHVSSPPAELSAAAATAVEMNEVCYSFNCNEWESSFGRSAGQFTAVFARVRACLTDSCWTVFCKKCFTASSRLRYQQTADDSIPCRLTRWRRPIAKPDIYVCCLRSLRMADDAPIGERTELTISLATVTAQRRHYCCKNRHTSRVSQRKNNLGEKEHAYF
jgi:hypothetical protein